MHLYEAGVPLPYIRDILGHVDLSTTEIYARASTEAKRKALEAAYPDISSDDLPEWNQDPGLLDWLTVRTRKSCERAWQVAGVAGSRADAGDCPGGQPGCWGGVAQAWRSSGLAVQGRNRSSAGPVRGFPPLRPHSSR